VALLRRRKARDYCERSLRLSREGYHEEALAAASRAIRIAPQHALAHHLRGSALSDLGRHAEALDSFRQALALDPALIVVHSKIALELEFLDRNAEALDVYTEVLQSEPGMGPFYFYRARVLRTLGRYEEALADYDQALRLGPRMANTREEKGITLALAGRYHDALGELEAAAEATMRQSTGRACVWQGAIAWHRDNPREARRLFEQAKDKPMGNNPRESANLRAIVSCALGDAEDAADFLRAEADPLDPATRAQIGGLYDLLSDPPMPGIDGLRGIVLGLSKPRTMRLRSRLNKTANSGDVRIRAGLADHRAARDGPAGHAIGHVDGLPPGAGQGLGGIGGPGAGPADHVHLAVLRDLSRPRSDRANGDMHGLRGVPGGPLVIFAHVE